MGTHTIYIIDKLNLIKRERERERERERKKTPSLMFDSIISDIYLGVFINASYWIEFSRNDQNRT